MSKYDEFLISKTIMYVVFFYRNLHKKEKLSLIEFEKQYISSLNELQKSEDECFRIGCCLDEINNKLHEALAKCSEKLLEYEYVSNLNRFGII